MKKLFLTILGLCLLVAVVVGISISKKSKSSVKGDSTTAITLSEITTHNSQNSCWTAINGGVYDITKFIPQHEGGSRILSACGIDATDLFTGKSPLGRAHSAVAMQLLSSMKIGVLQQ